MEGDRLHLFRAKSLGVVLDDPYCRCGDVYYASNPLAAFFEHLQSHFPNGLFLSPPVSSGAQLQHNSDLYQYRCNSQLRFVDRPFYEYKFDFLSRITGILLPTTKALSRLVRSTDMLLIRLPSAVAVIAYVLARIYRKPVVLYIAGDLVQRARHIPRSSRLRRQLMAVLVSMYGWFEGYMAKHSPCLIFGEQLYRRLGARGRSIKFAMSLVSQQHIWHRNDVCQTNPITILYVGRMAHSKGIHTLIDATSRLRERHLNVELRLVGHGPLAKSLARQVATGNLPPWIVLVGSRPFGPALFDEYKKGDIFVLPSLSEGIPKVLFEAMAFGLPIVATQVGGIPDIIQHKINGLLVQPLDAPALARAIVTLVEAPELRQRIMKENYKRVAAYTMEHQANKFMQFITRI